MSNIFVYTEAIKKIIFAAVVVFICLVEVEYYDVYVGPMWKLRMLLLRFISLLLFVRMLNDCIKCILSTDSPLCTHIHIHSILWNLSFSPLPLCCFLYSRRHHRKAYFPILNFFFSFFPFFSCLFCCFFFGFCFATINHIFTVYGARCMVIEYVELKICR